MTPYDTLLQNATGIITICDSYFITKCDRSLLQNASRFLLQNATFITNCESTMLNFFSRNIEKKNQKDLFRFF